MHGGECVHTHANAACGRQPRNSTMTSMVAVTMYPQIEAGQCPCQKDTLAWSEFVKISEPLTLDYAQQVLAPHPFSLRGADRAAGLSIVSHPALLTALKWCCTPTQPVPLVLLRAA